MNFLENIKEVYYNLENNNIDYFNKYYKLSKPKKNGVFFIDADLLRDHLLTFGTTGKGMSDSSVLEKENILNRLFLLLDEINIFISDNSDNPSLIEINFYSKYNEIFKDLIDYLKKYY